MSMCIIEMSILWLPIIPLLTCEAICITLISWFIIACLQNVSRLGLSTGCHLPWKPARSPHLSVSMVLYYQFTSVPLYVHWGFLHSSQHQSLCLKESSLRHHTEVFGYPVLLLAIYEVILPLDWLYFLLAFRERRALSGSCIQRQAAEATCICMPTLGHHFKQNTHHILLN